MISFSANKIFSGFKSLCATRWSWQYSTAEIIYWKSLRARDSGSFPREAIKSKSSPPVTYSITTKISCTVSSTSYRRIIFGCLKNLKSRISRFTFIITSLWNILILSRSFLMLWLFSYLLFLLQLPSPKSHA